MDQSLTKLKPKISKQTKEMHGLIAHKENLCANTQALPYLDSIAITLLKKAYQTATLFIHAKTQTLININIYFELLIIISNYS